MGELLYEVELFTPQRHFWSLSATALGDVERPRRSPGTASTFILGGTQLYIADMWNDEDNNPYGAFDPDSRLSESLHSAALSPRELPPRPAAVMPSDFQQPCMSMIPRRRPAVIPI